MTLLIEDTGFWAQVGDPTPDGTHLILNVPSTKVTPVTQDWADWLNRNCPCGIPGAWAPNAAREFCWVEKSVSSSQTNASHNIPPSRRAYNVRAGAVL